MGTPKPLFCKECIEVNWLRIIIYAKQMYQGMIPVLIKTFYAVFTYMCTRLLLEFLMDLFSCSVGFDEALSCLVFCFIFTIFTTVILLILLLYTDNVILVKPCLLSFHHK